MGNCSGCPEDVRSTDGRYLSVSPDVMGLHGPPMNTSSMTNEPSKAPSDNGFHGRRVPTGEIEAGVHVEPEPSVGVDVRPEERREPAPLVWTDEVVEFGHFQDRLDQ